VGRCFIVHSPPLGIVLMRRGGIVGNPPFLKWAVRGRGYQDFL